MRKDLTGQKFNRLTVVEYLGSRKNASGKTRGVWLCQCDCGNTCEVDTSHLTTGHTTSCGCRQKENCKGKNNCNYVNGLSQTRLGRIYRNMINRCYNFRIPMYQYYGAKGISVCEEWRGKFIGLKNFCDWALSHGYTNELTLDRIDPKGNYEPSNCRWATIKEQANNKIKTYKLKINGEVDTVGNWATRLEISYWNLLNYARGKSNNTKYPELQIERV